MATDQELRAHIMDTVMDRFSSDQEKRKEALFDFLGVSMPGLDADTADKLAELVPPVMGRLYEKWTGMFIDRLFETVPRPQIEHLCDGTKENNSALLLIYIMYLESATMEEQIARDLHEYGLSQTGAEDMGDVVADYIRARMATIGEGLKKKQ